MKVCIKTQESRIVTQFDKIRSNMADKELYEIIFKKLL